MTILYFAGLAGLIFYVHSKNSVILIQTHFTLALILKIENEQLLQKHGMKARPGYLSKWIEIHKCGNRRLVEDDENMFSR